MIKLEYSDDKLLDLILKKGKVNYFEMLYDRFAPFVYNKCLWFVTNNDDAKDLTQEIFIKIYLNLGKFKGNSKLSTWIYSITIHSCIENARKGRNKPRAIRYDEFQFHSIDQLYDETETSYAELLDHNYEKLEEILNSLTPEDRSLLLMKYHENLSIGKIVELLDLKESAVKMRLLRARKKVMDLRMRSVVS